MRSRRRAQRDAARMRSERLRTTEAARVPAEDGSYYACAYAAPRDARAFHGMLPQRPRRSPRCRRATSRDMPHVDA